MSKPLSAETESKLTIFGKAFLSLQLFINFQNSFRLGMFNRKLRFNVVVVIINSYARLLHLARSLEKWLESIILLFCL